MAIKKILILAMPRTGSTIIQQILSNAFDIENLSEPLHKYFVQTAPTQQYNSDSNPYNWAASVSSGVIKVLSTVLEHLDFTKFIEAGNFDYIVLIERTDLLSGLLSLTHAELTKTYHRLTDNPIESRTFTVSQFDQDLWKKSYALYNQSKQLVIESGIPYNLVNYESFMADVQQTVAGYTLQKRNINFDDYNIMPNKLCYKDLCINYQEVKSYVMDTIHELEFKGIPNC